MDRELQKIKDRRQLIQNNYLSLAQDIWNSNLEAEIYKLERELETAIMNDRSWEAECLRSDIKDLEIQLQNELDNPQE